GSCLVLLAVIWATSGIGHGPNEVLFWGVLTAVVFVIVLSAGLATRCSAGLRLVTVVLAMTGVAGMAYSTVNGGFGSFRLGTDVASWQRTAEAIQDGRPIATCTTPRS